MKIKLLLCLSFIQVQASDKVLLVSGFPSDGIELLDLSKNISCLNKLPPTPNAVVSNFGGLIDNNTLLICGGSYVGNRFDTCHTLNLPNGEHFVESASLNIGRCCGDSVQFNDHEILVAGGLDNLSNFPMKTELVSHGSTRPGPTLPYSVLSPCMVRLNNSIIALTGGYNQDDVFDTISFYHQDTGKWLNGPPMPVPKYDHGCATMVLDGSEYLVLAGGTSYYAANSDSVEILDLATNQWTHGPALPGYRYALALVQAETKDRLYAIGGVGNGTFLDLVLEMHCSKGLESCQWKPKQQLLNPRAYFLAIPIANALISCEDDEE